MNTNKVCLNCGSASFVSDRSLGGKIVCIKCGSAAFKKVSFLPNKNIKFIFFVLGVVFLIIII